MSEQLYEVMIVVLVVLILALVTALTLLSRRSIDASKEQFPPGTLDGLLSLLQIASGLVKSTPTPVDDEGLKLIAGILGFKVTTENGQIVVRKVDEPAPIVPPTVPPSDPTAVG